jgi:pSer/pThr/pTyr-binding forkhead associated (FHA) protein
VAKLVFVDQGISTEFLLDDVRGEISLGRSPSCTVRVNNPSLSRVHAVLVREGSPARYRVVDRGSSNGTYVNGQRKDDALLRHGDQLMCGEFVFLFVDDAGGIGGESRSMPPMPSPMPTQGRMALEVTDQAGGTAAEGSAAPAGGTRSVRPLSTDAQIAQVTEDGFYAALEQADGLRMELELSQREREMLSEQVRGLMFEVNRLRSEPQTALEQAALSDGSLLGEDVVRRQSLEQMGRLRGQVEKLAAEREELLVRCRRLTELEQENRRLREQLAAAAGPGPASSELVGRLEKMKEAFMQLDTEMLELVEVNRGLRSEVERLRGGGR